MDHLSPANFCRVCTERNVPSSVPWEKGEDQNSGGCHQLGENLLCVQTSRPWEHLLSSMFLTCLSLQHRSNGEAWKIVLTVALGIYSPSSVPKILSSLSYEGSFSLGFHPLLKSSLKAVQMHLLQFLSTHGLRGYGRQKEDAIWWRKSPIREAGPASTCLQLVLSHLFW